MSESTTAAPDARRFAGHFPVGFVRMPATIHGSVATGAHPAPTGGLDPLFPMNTSLRHLLFVATSLLGTAALPAQMGDSRDPAGVVQKPPSAEWKIPPAPVLSPQEALKTFSLPPGFRIELVASEPLVHEPVALDFDADGRLWVVEMRSYMPNADGTGEAELINRIVILEDTDHDGRMDKSTVYLDGLGLVRAIKVLQHGVLVGEPPNLWYTRDIDGDGRADEKTAIATDFSQRDANPEVGANGLIWGLDNWIVGSSYGRRLRLLGGKWISAPVALRGQWGQSMDDYGRFFTNASEVYLRADLIPNHYPARNPNLIPSNSRREQTPNGVNYQVDAEQSVWSIRPNPGVNRGYWEGHLRKDGTLQAFTANCGPAIYRGDNFPAEFQGNYFSAEPAAHIVRRAIVTEQDGILSAHNAYDKSEFLRSTDERFRPVNLYTAPDGTLYVLDLYRGILQHRQFMTSYLRRQVMERGLDKGLGYGRIYRIVHEAKKPGPPPALSQRTPAELVGTLSHPNGWWRDTAQRLLVERGDLAVVPGLRALASAEGTSVPVRLKALWTMEGLGALDPAVIARAMDDPSPKVRATAIRLSEPFLAANDLGLLNAVSKHSRDASREVRLQVALSLGEAKSPDREAVLAELLHREATAPFLTAAVVSGLAGSELGFLERLVATPDWRESKPGLAPVFETLAATLVRTSETTKLNRLFQLIGSDAGPAWQRRALLGGIRASGVRNLAALPSELEATVKSSDPEIARGAQELLTRLVWPGKFGAGPVPLTEAEQRIFEKGRTAYATICAACHQPDGRGLPGVAASLVDSTLVDGPDEILARIVLKGKVGKNPAAMPALEMLSNETIAAALTYVRRSWGHTAAPVSTGTVGAMRFAIIVRSQPYTDAELQTLKP